MHGLKTQAVSKRNVILVTGLGVCFIVGCAPTIAAPTQQLADVEAASRSANELGAQSNPQAQLYLKLADEQLRDAKVALAQDDNMEADRLLTRAKLDAELAVALTRDGMAKQGAGNAAKAANAAQAAASGGTP